MVWRLRRLSRIRKGLREALRFPLGLFWRFTVLLAMLVAATAAPAAPDDGFQRWLETLRAEALAHGIRASTFDAAFAGVVPIPRVVELDRRQPEFTQTFWSYLDKRVTPSRIARGQEMLARHRDVLDAVSRRYGVQPRFLVAFWGLETNYGGNTGSYSLVAALATLAYDTRRSDFFREQLLAALELMDQGDVPIDATSSWAGALGHPQFMPTSYRAYAVDFDGDGRRDLWNSVADVFASAANFLAAAGWRDDQTWGREVRLPSGFDYAQSGLEVVKPLAEWQRLGVRKAGGGDLPAVDIEGSVIVPGGAAGGAAFIVYSNFKSIMAWNRSILYAVAVGHLSDRLIGKPPLQASRPAAEVPLARGEVMEMQDLLSRLGLDAGEADGIVGPATRKAVRAFQAEAALPSDGYPTAALLDRLRAAASP